MNGSKGYLISFSDEDICEGCGQLLLSFGFSFSELFIKDTLHQIGKNSVVAWYNIDERQISQRNQLWKDSEIGKPQGNLEHCPRNPIKQAKKTKKDGSTIFTYYFSHNVQYIYNVIK